MVFAKYDGRIVGILLGYSWRSKYNKEEKTGWLLLKILGFDFLKRLPAFISARSGGSGKLDEGDYYIGNIAVYPEFRGKKIGKA